MTTQRGLGLLLPIEKGPSGYFRRGFDVMTQMKSNLTNLILTKKGERVMQPTFGCDIHGLIFENITDDLIANVKATIQEAAGVWLPFISIDEVKITKKEKLQEIYVSVSFSLRTNVSITDTITVVI